MWVFQERKYTDPFGRTRLKVRYNPFNPLTYILVLILILIGLLMYGFSGFREEVNLKDVFTWADY